MKLEISCEVRNREFRGRRQTFVIETPTAVIDIDAVMKQQFNGAWCVHPVVRIADESTERRKPGRPRKVM